MMSLNELNPEKLYKLMWLFCDAAYFKKSVPNNVIEKTHFGRDGNILDFLHSKKLVESYQLDEGNHIEKFWIRMGNDFYPHMKICISHLVITDAFICSVDTHDQHVLDILPSDSDEWKKFYEIHVKNMKLKVKIEQRWRREGIPTESSYLESEALQDMPRKDDFPPRYVLVADDEDHIRLAIKEILTWFNCQSILAQDGQKALALVHQENTNIAFAILDVMMPGCSGPQMVESLKQEHLLTFPYMFLSGMPRHLAIKDDSVEFLTKPFTKAILVEKIRGIIKDLPECPA